MVKMEELKENMLKEEEVREEWKGQEEGKGE